MKVVSNKLLCLLGASFSLCLVPTAAAAELAVRLIDQPVPAELGDSIRSVLPGRAVQLLEGDQAVGEFWFRDPIPLGSAPESPAKALNAVKETTLLGAVRLHRTLRDYRDNDFEKGLYTMRFSLQPADGDHLGTAIYPHFLVLIPAPADSTLDGIAQYKPMVKASGKATATGHPVVLSLRPPSDAKPDIPSLKEPEAEHRSIRLRLSGKAPAADAPVPIDVELVFEGHGKI